MSATSAPALVRRSRTLVRRGESLVRRNRLTAHRRRTLAAIGVPTAAAAVLVFWNLGGPSMMGTEAVTYWAAHQSPGVLAHVLHHVDVVHGTYYALMHLLFQLGGGTFVLRLPSALGMTAAVALTGLLARRVSGSDRVAFFCAGSLATMPVLSNYGQTGRAYALIAAVVAGTTYLLLRCLDGRGAGRWWAYSGALTVCVYLHEFTLLVVAAHAVTLAWSGCRAALPRWLVHVAVAMVASLPLLLFSAGQAGQVGYIRSATWSSVTALARLFLGPSALVFTINAALAAAAVVAGVLHRGRGVTVVRLGLPLLVLPPALLIGESTFAHPYYGGGRYVLYCVVGLALLVGAGLETVLAAALRIGPRWIGAMTGAALLAGVFAWQLPLQISQHSTSGKNQNLLGVATYLRARSRPGDAVLYLPRSLYSVRMAYPGDVSRLDDIAEATSPQSSGTLYGTPVDPVVLREEVDEQYRLWIVAAPTPGRTPDTEVFAVRHGFRLASDVPFRGASVLLYVHPGLRRAADDPAG